MSELSTTEHALLGAPHQYLTPLERPTLEQAKAWCAELTKTHYENFHVASLLLPRALRSHFHAVYAYCRWSDDLADEINDAAK